MKRVVSCLLAVVLICAPCLQGYAVGERDDGTEAEAVGAAAADHMGSDGIFSDEEEKNGFDNDTGGETPEENAPAALTEEKQQTEERAEVKKEEEDLEADGRTVSTGQVNVEMISALILERDVEFTVSLTGQEEKQIILKRDDKTAPQRCGVTFDALVPGSYTLMVSAPGFASYTQEIWVENYAYSLKLMTGFVSGYEEGPHPGVLLIGDADQNGVINETDKTLLVDAIDGTSGIEAENGFADLNGDDAVDLVDLEYLAKGYLVSAVSSTIEIGVPAEAVKVKADSETTYTEGDLSKLLTNEGGSVKLRPAEGGEISGERPVSLEFDLTENGKRPVGAMAIETESGNSIRSMVLEVLYEDDQGTDQTVNIPMEEGVDFLLFNENIRAIQDERGTITIDFGDQIAVKKVTLHITGMKKDASLAEISKVEFLNGMENRIPEPALDIPGNLVSESGNKTFILTWDAQVNVTGYEALIAHEGEEEIVFAKGNTLKVSSFLKKELINGRSYSVRVRSVNGTWRSGYSEPLEIIPKVDRKPDAPDNLKVTGAYRAVNASWKKMKDTDSYNLYYREEGEGSFQKIEKITGNSYTISDLKDHTSYEVYVTGVNELGEGKPSLTGIAVTTDLEPAQMPRYKLINYAEEGKVSRHIIQASYASGSMVDSPLDTENGTAWGTVDNNPISHFYHNTWDSGGYNPMGANGLIYEFDQAYQLRDIALQEVSVNSMDYLYVRVRYWDAEGKQTETGVFHMQKKTDASNRVYYLIRLPQPVTVKKIQIGVARYLATGPNTVSEVYFYHYDTIEDEIMALYEDDLHTVLRSDVTQETIDALRKRLNTKDEVSGEYHPELEKLERELKTAEDILHAKLSDPVRIHNSITTKDVNRGFGGINAWQPLGVTAAAGEEITVYVGHNSKKTGENTGLQLIATQYHAESSNMASVVTALKIGRNDITLPKLSTTQAEAGGALYVHYTGDSAEDQYAVRVSGGVEVPVLDLYQVADQGERLKRAETYLLELKTYVDGIEAKHKEVHKGAKYASVNAYDYEARNCILGASDLLLDTMLLSLPAQQILAGSGGSAEKLLNSMDAMEKMMELFYQHKGLNAGAPDALDRLPSGHLNIRYQKMFAGAFMYASGNHIGIEWNETAGMVCAVPVQADADGRYISGRYFGWGIAHEIGHCINQKQYAVAEITNNYYSILAQAQDRNDSVRFKYTDVYNKVTSGATGAASNVFTQLGMYWQLHLAYDNGYNYKIYADSQEQLQNLFFARVDTYARNTGRAPSPGGIVLTLTGDTDQNLMRLSCAAAEKNLLEFFIRWGMTPDADTFAYASQFMAETKAIYYANDQSRVYRMEHSGDGSLGTDGDVEAVGSGTMAAVNAVNKNQVDIQLTSDQSEILGYEITRCIISGGKETKEVIGFTTESSYSDYITTMNNRVVTYEITAIDHYLNRSAVKRLEPSLKIEHRGNISKTDWTASTNDITATSKEAEGAEKEESCAAQPESPIRNAIDSKTDTVYTGTAGQNAEVTLEFNRSHRITGFAYTAGSGTPIQEYEILVRDAQGSWISVASGILGGDKTVYFGKNGNVAAYDTRAVRLKIQNQSGTEISIAELDVLGITGDNVELESTMNGIPAIGRLSADFRYDTTDPNKVIPKGSIVFTGEYKGNPAYNVVVLYDQEGNIVSGGGSAEQIILAAVPSTGNIQDVNIGSWVYWIRDDSDAWKNLKKVRAELYRVDNAETNEGQRMVSDSLFLEMPETLPEITLTSGSGN